MSSVIFSFASDEVIRRYVYIKDFNINDLDKPIIAVDLINFILFFLILFLFFFIDDINYVFALIAGLVLSYRSPFIASNVARKELNYLSFYTFFLNSFFIFFY